MRGNHGLRDGLPINSSSSIRVLVDAANAARDEAAAATTQAPTTTVPPVEPEPLIGVLTLDSGDVEGEQDTCRKTGGYADFGAGMNITVRDGSGASIATSISQSFAEPGADDPQSLDQAEIRMRTLGDRIRAAFEWGASCVVCFVADVPEPAFYEIEVGRRGSPSPIRSTISYARSGGWSSLAGEMVRPGHQRWGTRRQ